MMVVVHHSTFLITSGFFYDIARFMGSGVDLFFIISGFLITNILLEKKGERNFLRNFYVRRFLRIVPLYYAILLVATFVIPNITSPYTEKFKNINLLPYWFFVSNYAIAARGHVQHGLIDVSWSLSLEEQFYVFWSLCVCLFNFSQLKKIAILVIILCPILRLVALISHTNPLAIHFMTHTRIDTIMFGALLALLLKEQVQIINKGPIIASSAFLLFGINHWLGFSYGGALQYSFLSLFYLGVVITLIYDPKSIRFISQNKMIQEVGVYSFGIYLFHNPIQKLLQYPFMRMMSHFEVNILVKQLLFIFFVMITSILMAGFSYHFYEKKWLSLKKYF